MTGGLKSYVYQQVRDDPQLLADLAHELLDANFPPSLHDDILAAGGAGLSLHGLSPSERDPSSGSVF